MRVRLVTALLGASLVTSACSDDEPAAGPTLPPITETPSASPTAEAVPTEATAATPQGAAEFVRYFYDELERAYETRDGSALRQISAPECESCTFLASAVEALASEGATVSGYEIAVADVVAPSLSANAVSGVTAVVSYSEYVERSIDGAELYRAPAEEEVIQTFDLRRTDDAWLVTAVRS